MSTTSTATAPATATVPEPATEIAIASTSSLAVARTSTSRLASTTAFAPIEALVSIVTTVTSAPGVTATRPGDGEAAGDAEVLVVVARGHEHGLVRALADVGLVDLGAVADVRERRRRHHVHGGGDLDGGGAREAGADGVAADVVLVDRGDRDAGEAGARARGRRAVLRQLRVVAVVGGERGRLDLAAVGRVIGAEGRRRRLPVRTSMAALAARASTVAPAPM